MSVLASGTAVLLWFGLYKAFYKLSLSPGLPGEGVFQYVAWRDPVAQVKRPASSRLKAADNKWSSKVRWRGN